MINNKYAIYIIPVAFALAALLLVVFGIYPLANGIKTGSVEILSQRGRVFTAQSQNRELEMFQERYAEYQPNLTATDALFVDAKDPLDFITFLESVASQTGVHIDVSLIPSGGKTVGSWPALAFYISAQGDFKDVAVFSEKLETGSYIIRIEKMSIQKTEESGIGLVKKTPGDMKVDITVMVAAK